MSKAREKASATEMYQVSVMKRRDQVKNQKIPAINKCKLNSKILHSAYFSFLEAKQKEFMKKEISTPIIILWSAFQKQQPKK